MKGCDMRCKNSNRGFCEFAKKDLIRFHALLLPLFFFSSPSSLEEQQRVLLKGKLDEVFFKNQQDPS